MKKERGGNIDSVNKSTWLKWIALVSMTIDHIGAILYPELFFLRIITIGFPFFAYQLAVGMQHTSNVNKYQKRLFWFCLISQIPYMLAFGSLAFNIYVTLFLGSLLIRFYQKWWIYTLLVLPFFLPINYEWYGLLLPLLFFVFRNKQWLLWLSFSYATVFYSLFSGFIGGLAMLFALPLLLYPRYSIWLPKISKNFFYWYYPLHLLGLYVIKQLFFT